MNSSMLNNRKGREGVTLIEALVTLVILSLGLIPALAIISSSISISSLIKNNLVAANLAQEGIEVVRSLRDANWFFSPVPLPFQTGLVGTWRVEWNTSLAPSSLNPPMVVGTNPPLKYHPSTGLYDYTVGIDGVDTVFKRQVSITQTADPCNCELIVTSRIDWVQQGKSRTISVEDHLFNWK